MESIDVTEARSKRLAWQCPQIWGWWSLHQLLDAQHQPTSRDSIQNPSFRQILVLSIQAFVTIPLNKDNQTDKVRSCNPLDAPPLQRKTCFLSLTFPFPPWAPQRHANGFTRLHVHGAYLLKPLQEWELEEATHEPMSLSSRYGQNLDQPHDKQPQHRICQGQHRR